MTRLPRVLAFAFIVAILIITAARAQADESTIAKDKPAKAGGDHSLSAPSSVGLELLRIDQVRSDLRISGEQEQKLMALSLGEGVGKGEGLKDLKKKAAAVLTAQQRARLKELHLQAMGPAALGDPAVVKALNYTSEQRKMAKALPAQVREATNEALQGVETARDRILKTREAQETIFKAALEALTPAQREMFEKMRGPKINVDFSELAQ